MRLSYKYLNNIELGKAVEIYLDKVKQSGFSLGTEEIEVRNSLGRITSEAVLAKISSPHYNACAMDGIAVFARDTFGATDTTPVVLKESKDFLRVDTGDPLPERFDSVVMIEDVIDMGEDAVKLIGAATPWQHVRQIGEDICAGEMILPSNTRIDPAAIGAMLAGGILKVKVRKKPVVGLIPTGDEIVSPTDNPKEGEILEFNSSVFSSMLEKWGCSTKVYGIVPDKFELIKSSIGKAASECDTVIINAASSAGREDFSARAIGEAGEVFIHGIAIRPGKPTILGMVNGRPVIGVPGYPVSGIIVMENLVKPVIEYLASVKCPQGPKVVANISKKLVSSLKYEEFVRVKLGDVDGKLIATPLNRGAGVITSFVRADGMVQIPLNVEGYENGEQVEVQLLRDPGEIKNTLVVTGSHDPLIDVISDMTRRLHPDEFISSAHVGSMGGIMAIKRGEAHLAGIHLLDEVTGEYNASYIKKYLAKERILLVKCVKRIQGLIVAPGNPKGIKGLANIPASSLKYVNRQKGSGTRILLDYLLKQEKIDPGDIYGYEREEFTHMSVAALIASGSADAGMGIYSAAKIYGLDFIPLCEEQYDFILPERYMEMKTVKHLIEILKSGEFRATLADMGGYRVEDSGEVAAF